MFQRLNPRPSLLVMGSESHGMAETRVLPSIGGHSGAGRAESLNASVAGAIAVAASCSKDSRRTKGAVNISHRLRSLFRLHPRSIKNDSTASFRFSHVRCSSAVGASMWA